MHGQHHTPDPEGTSKGLPSDLATTTRGSCSLAATEELARLLEVYLAELDAGRAPDRTRFIAQHPHLAPALEEALAGLDLIRLAPPAENRFPSQLGDFRILREVGRGGMGVVYEAEQISLNRRVALKVLRHGPAADEVAMRRFQREAETVGRLHHTNIVPIFAIGADDGVRYYAMQFIEGRDLGHVAQTMRNGAAGFDFQRIADWGLQAADALAHAHQRGVIHRDIKPSNLILDHENRIWLTDFGLARRIDDASLSLTGALLGTPRYMSPEQAAAAARRPIDHRTDLYSLGATLYELVTSRPIFDASSPHEVISLILHTEPRRPRLIAPGIPRDLETIILTCLAKDPAHRYPDARTLAEDLRAFAAGRPIAARQPRLVERTTRWVRQHRRQVATVATSAAASILLAVGVSFAWKSYATARLGRLQFSTASSGALAEILDPQGNTIVPLFPVPNESPVALPAGPYQVRLAAPETLSETWPIEVTAKLQAHHAINLSSRWLWPPQDFGAPQAFELVPLGNKTGFLVLLSPKGDPGEPATPLRLRLLDGESTRPVWSRDLAFDASTLPGHDLHDWQALLAHWAAAPVFAGTHIGDRVTDLNHDGAGDFILVSRSSASLLAISGASGQVLWWHRSRPTLPPGTPQDGRWAPGHPGRSFVVSHPAVADLDGDHTDDVVACFSSQGETYDSRDGTSHDAIFFNWIAAISGRTGLELWRQPVRAAWGEYATSSSGARFDTLAHPTVTRLKDGLAVVLADDDGLHVLDARTGRPADRPVSPGLPVERAPIFFSPSGPSKTHALLLRRFIDSDAHLEMVAFDLETGSVRWRQTPLTVLGGVAGELDALVAETFTPVNLENDNTEEIVTLTGHHPEAGRWTFGVQVLDAATGRPRWETHLHDAGHPQSIPGDARFLAGPDLDHDGSQEIFAVLPALDPATKRHGVLSAALSGATGAILWRRHHPGIAGIRSLDWWHDGTDGWPMLVATTTAFSGGRSSTFVFAAGSGEITHTLLDVREVRIADLDGDGAPDLLHPVRSQNALRWAAIRGQPGPLRQLLGSWLAGPGADGDPADDFFQITGNQLSARSGHDGRLLWTTTSEFASPESLWTQTSSGRNPTRSDEGLLFAAVNRWRRTSPDSRQTYRSLAAFSARDGRMKWTSPDFELGGANLSGSTLGWAYSYPFVESMDLDNDETPEILASCITDASNVRLSVISGRDGKVLWDTPILAGAMAPDPRPAGAPIADFNADGIRDIALILPPTSTNATATAPGFHVDVRHGITGKSLWPAPFLLAQDPRHIVWPEPTLGDLDGDNVPELLVVRHQGYRDTRGYACELVVLDGRSGQVRWTWRWDAGFPTLWAPLVLTSPDPTRRRVAVGVNELNHAGFEIVILDATGKPEFRRDITLSNSRPDRGGLAWTAMDLDGDGTSELIYPSEGFLCAAFGLNGDVRWRKPLAGGGEEGFRILSGLPSGTEPDTDAILALWTGRDVFGIQGSRGNIVWRGRAPAEPTWGNAEFPHVRLVRTGTSTARPGLQFLPPLARSDTTSIEPSWPTTPEGRYRSHR